LLVSKFLAGKKGRAISGGADAAGATGPTLATQATILAWISEMHAFLKNKSENQSTKK
jgi:hypothetical protein